MARARLRPSAYLTPPRPPLRERTASRDWKAQGGVDDARRAVSPPGSDWTAAAWAWRRRATDFSAPEAVAVPAARLGGGEGDHAKSGVGHRGQQVRRPWRLGQRVRGCRKQEVQGWATAGDRSRERASPFLPGGASREPLPRCLRSPLRPVRASGGSRRSVTGVGIKRDGGKESRNVAGVLLMSGTRALGARTQPPPAGPCRPQCPALSVVCSRCCICAGL